MKAKPVFTIAFISVVIFTSILLAAQEQRAPITIPPAPEILSRLKKEHPRLVVSAADWERLKTQIKTEKLLASWYGPIQKEGNRILQQPPSKYEIPDGLRLLSVSRRVVNRMYVLALLYHIEGDQKYVDRTWQELKAAAEFKDWNPRHFLDTAEMTHAFAIGYDWLYQQWTPEQRATLREAMIEKGIKLANDVHSRNTWWAKARHNWNQVCNGGIGLGALAIADEAPELAGAFLEAALKSIQLPMAEYGPDGAWAEGPGYWSYATSYNVVFLAALDTALGTDFGLSHIPGFAESGMFPIYAAGPRGYSFNYADAGESIIKGPQMFWLARKFNRPAYAWYARQYPSIHPLDLIWYDPRGATPMPEVLPLDKYFRHSEVVTWRSAWNDRNALFAGLKAGDNAANHSNLDLGSFVLEALGTRWAVELGADNYNMPGYFGKERWTYYRLRAEGHNTLVINPNAEADQAPKAVARITRFESRPDYSFAIADLTPAYAKPARKVQRGLAMLNREQMLVQDEIQADKPAEVWWFMHTKAQIKLGSDAATATLSQGNQQLEARLVSPKGAQFTIREAKPLPTSPNPELQNKNAGVQKLAIRLPEVTETRLAVLFTPLRSDQTEATPTPPIKPLADW